MSSPIWSVKGSFQPPVTLTFMEALSSEASYWVVLFIRPNIRASRGPDSAPFRAVIRSWKGSDTNHTFKMSRKQQLGSEWCRLFRRRYRNTNMFLKEETLRTFLANRSYSKAISLRCSPLRLVRMSMMVCSSTPAGFNQHNRFNLFWCFNLSNSADLSLIWLLGKLMFVYLKKVPHFRFK